METLDREGSIRRGSTSGSSSARALLLVLLLAAALWTGHFALTFRGLEASDAFNYAQVARNLARGRGYVTQESLPYEFLLFPEVPHPELLHPPLAALAESAFFAIFGPQEWAAVLPGAIAYVLTAPLVYFAACRWAGPVAGALSAALFLTHPASAAYASSGLAESLCGLLLTASILVVAATGGERRWPIMLSAGILLGLNDLARETGRYLFPAAGVLLWGMRPGRAARLGGVLAGYLAVVLSNQVRIAAATGHPFTSYAPAMLMCGIPPFHGLDWYRGMSAIDPFHHLARAPHLLLYKVAFNVSYLAATFGRIVSPVLAAGALAASKLAPRPEMRRAAVLAAVAVLIQVGVTALFLVDLRHFVPMVPLFAVLGSGSAGALWSRGGWRGRAVAVAGLVWVLAVQSRGLIQELEPVPVEAIARRKAERELGEWVAQRTGPDDVVITDVSEIIAWVADRRTVWYPLDESLLDRIPRGGRGEQVLLLTSLSIAPEPANPRFGARPPSPWLRYLEGNDLAPPGFELVGERHGPEVTARLFRRRAGR